MTHEVFSQTLSHSFTELAFCKMGKVNMLTNKHMWLNDMAVAGNRETRVSLATLSARKRPQQRLQSWVDGVNSNDISERLSGTRQLRRLLYKSGSRTYHVKEQVINLDLVTKFLQFLSERNFSLQGEAALVLAKFDLASFPQIAAKLKLIFRKLFSKESSLQRLCRLGLLSDHKIPQLMATKRLRALLPAKVMADKMGQITKSRVLPQLVNILYREGYSELKAETAWVFFHFTFYAATFHYKYLVKHHLVAPLVKLLEGKVLEGGDVRKKAVKALSIFVKGGTTERDLVLKLNVLQTLLPMCEEEAKSDYFIEDVIKILSSIYRIEPPPNISEDNGERVVKFLYELVESSVNAAVLESACSGLARISHCNLGIIRQVFQKNFEDVFCMQLVNILKHKSIRIKIPTLHIVACIVESGMIQPKSFCNDVAIRAILSILESGNMEYMMVYKETGRGNPKEMVCYIIGLFCLDGEEGVKCVIEGGAIEKLVKLIQEIKNDDGNGLKHMAAKAIKLAICSGTPGQIEHLVENQGIVEALCDLLVCQAKGIIDTCLEGLNKILEVVKVSDVTLRITMCGGFDKIKNLDDAHYGDSVRSIMAYASLRP